MDSDFREKAKEVLRKQLKRFEPGGGFYDWTDEEQKIWRQINALPPSDRSDLDREVSNSLTEDLRREINRQNESLRQSIPGIEIRDLEPFDFDQNNPVLSIHRFTCESCGRSMFIPIRTSTKDEVLQRLEREKTAHRKECMGRRT